jgi:putative heme-binding domain-containing protein
LPFVAGACLAQVPQQGTVAAGKRAFSAEAVEQGRELYNRSCTSCHGQDGTVGDRAPALAARRKYLRTSERDLFDAIKNGIAGTLMPASPLPDGDVSKIVGFILNLRATAIDSPVEGDVARGQRIFETQGGCLGCHTVDGRGGILGPDLSNIASERSARFLLEALTQPKPHIPQGYQPVRIVSTGGKSIEGILRNENNFSLQVLGKEGMLHLLSRGEVKEIEYGKQSLMPSNYDKTLDATALRDLLAYLSRRSRGR